MAIKRNDRLSFYGHTRSGKSTGARHVWITHRGPRVCIDVKDEHAANLPGIPTTSSVSEVFTFPTVRAVPPELDDEDWYNAIYAEAFKRGDYLIWLDEANEVSTAQRIPKAVRRFIVQGAGRGCGHITCTTRPSEIAPTFVAQAEHVFFFDLTHNLDRQAAARLMGVSEATVERLQEEVKTTYGKHGYIYFDVAERKVHKMAPLPHPDELTDSIRRLYFGPPD